MVCVGQNWRLDCNKSLHSAAELVPGRSIDTVSFCGWTPCHAEAALCENTSCKIHLQSGFKKSHICLARVNLRCLWKLFFFWLVAAWVKSRAERPSVSGVNRQLHVQIGCKLRIRNRKDELTKQAKRNKLQIKPEGN